MFKKILVANRGEIAVRIVRACRDMGIWAVAVYDAPDRDSLHVRLADECVPLTTQRSYMDGEELIKIAHETGAEAIHPGYGFMAEQPDFIRACEKAGIVFIGPSSEVMEALRSKIGLLERAQAAGFDTPLHSSVSFRSSEQDLYLAEAEQMGFPLLVKSCSGGRGRATRLVRTPDALVRAVREASAEAQIVFGNDSLFLEHAVMPANFIDVQILADQYGNMVHLGEREGSIQRNNQKLIAESPAPSVTASQRIKLHEMALQLARLFNVTNAATVEFLLDGTGKFYFTEIKARIQVEHPVTELVNRIDLVREQIEIAAGKRLSIKQDDVKTLGWAMQCRVNAEDPWNHYMPSPGQIRRFRLPGGPYVRVDTYGYSGCQVPMRYDPMLAKLVVWGEDREACVLRFRRALQDFAISGVRSNIPLYQRILEDPDFVAGTYSTDFMRRPLLRRETELPEELLRDLAVAAAIAYAARNQAMQSVVPERMQSGWHRSSRQLPG